MEELYVLTEVGMFGELEMEDPTKKKVNKKSDEMDLNAVIEAGIKANMENL